MPEELQGLLERIQKDGVDKAEKEAAGIVSAAQDKAKSIVQDAEAKAKAIVEKAEQDGAAFAQRAETSLHQAARDVVLAVGDAISAALKGIVQAKVASALTDDTLKPMLTEVVSAYCQGDKAAKVDLLLNPDQQQALLAYVQANFKAEADKGLDIKGDASVVSGFRVRMAADNIEHDFTGAAITDALCQVLRPQIANILRDATKE